MILDSLVQYYRALVSSGDTSVSPFGYTTEKISLALEIDEEGNLIGLLPQIGVDSRGKPVNYVSYCVPSHGTRTSGIKPFFLVDKTDYLLGISINKKTGELTLSEDRFEASKEFHRNILSGAKGMMAQAILNFFAKWNPKAWKENETLGGNIRNLMIAGFSSFVLDGEWSFRDEEVRTHWSNYSSGMSDGKSGICLITGERTSVIELHRGIKSVSGGQSSGTFLVSFNCDSFSSYGKSQGANAPVGERASFEYGEALQHLFGDKEHVLHIGNTSLIGWASSSVSAYQEIMKGCFSGFGRKNDSEARVGEESGGSPSGTSLSDTDVQLALASLARGGSIELQGVTLNPGERFSVLGVSPNGARLSVRFYWENDFGRFAENVMRHQSRLSIQRPVYAAENELSIFGLIRQTVRDGDLSKANPRLGGEMALAILNDSAYPATLLNGVDMRIRASGSITWQQAAIIKAFYLKNGPEALKEVMTVELNEESNYTPYLLGRLFAVLGFVQKDASGVTTLRDRYFNSASATPSLVFPLIINLAEKHLAKMSSEKRGLAISYERRITDLVGRVRTDFPKRLSLPERGAFQIGFYHETQKQYSK